jgi:hypothetical protein
MALVKCGKFALSGAGTLACALFPESTHAASFLIGQAFSPNTTNPRARRAPQASTLSAAQTVSLRDFALRHGAEALTRHRLVPRALKSDYPKSQWRIVMIALQNTNKSFQKVWRKGALLMGLVGFWIFILGFVTLLLGRLHYINYWGGAVFAPFALLIGVIAIVFAIPIRRRGD